MRALSIQLIGLLVGILSLGGCAALGTCVQGRSELVAWEATDLTLERRAVGTRSQWYYSFELVVREVRGIGITFTEIETAIYQPGTGSGSSRYKGSWRLGPEDQFRIPLVSSLACHPSFDACGGSTVPTPLWRVRMSGTDDRNRSASVVIDLTLPADPPSPPATTSKSVRAITLVPPKPAVPPSR